MRIIAKDEKGPASLRAEELHQAIEDVHGWAVAEQFDIVSDLKSRDDVQRLIGNGDLNDNALRILYKACTEDFAGNSACEYVANLLRDLVS
jgi:hypothetical protein